MALHARNLLLFLALAGAAVLTWVLSREPDAPDGARIGVVPASQGWYMLGAEIVGTDGDGRIVYSVIADRVDEEPEGGNLEFEQLRVEYAPETGIRWEISAARGLAAADDDYFRMRDVRLIRSPDANGNAMVIETNELELFADEFRVVSDDRVLMSDGSFEFSATGLSLNLETDAWALGEGRFRKRATRLAPLALLALPALPVFGQETAEGSAYDFQCVVFSGDAANTSCEGMTISQGGNSITAARATESETGQNGSIWRLEGSVHVVLENTELMADSGTFEFDEADELLYAELAGPVRMSDYDERNDTTFSGTLSDRISLDNRNTTLRAHGQISFFRDDDDFEGCELVYNWSDHTFSVGTTDCGSGRYRLTLPEASDTPEDPPETP